MKKMRKGKKMLLLLLIAIVVVIIAVVIIKSINRQVEPEIPDDTQQVIPLPETTYSDMQVKNVQMEYLKNNDETMISFEIHNTTSNNVEKENLDAILIGPDENVLGQMQTYIDALGPGEQYDISVILKGDLTSTTQIKLVKK